MSQPLTLHVSGYDMTLNEANNFHFTRKAKVKVKSEAKAVPLQAWSGPEGSRRFRLPDFMTFGNMKVVGSLASNTGRLYSQEIFLVLVSTRG